jgi:hypothetical protein
LACPIGLEDVRKLGLVGTADLLARLGDVLLRPGLMSPSTLRFAARLFFLGNASARESIDIPDHLHLPENR